jgi:hypothetical protein
MAGYSKEELIELLSKDDTGEDGGYACDELEAEAAVEKFYKFANGGYLPEGVASDLDEAAEYVYSNQDFWED